MDSLEIIKKHLTPEVPFKLKNEDGSEDTIYLKPLNVGEQTLTFSISKKMKELNKGGEVEVDKDVAKDMFDLFSSIVSRSIPNIDNEILENFVLSNFDSLGEVLEKLIPKPKSSEKLELIKKRFEEQKKAKEESK